MHEAITGVAERDQGADVVRRDAQGLVPGRQVGQSARRPGSAMNSSPAPGVCQIWAKSCHS